MIFLIVGKVMIFFCNFALIMRQRFFQPVISLLFAAFLMTGCGGKGSVKPLSITLDSIVIDTTATLEKGDVCKVHLKLHLFKGPACRRAQRLAAADGPLAARLHGIKL